MKATLALERDIWKSWRTRHFSGREPTYVTKARKTLPRRGKLCLEKGVIQGIRKASVLVVGDDRLVGRDQLLLTQLLSKAGWKKDFTLVSDRFFKKHQKELKAYLAGRKSLARITDLLQVENAGANFPEGGVAHLLEWCKQRKIQIEATGVEGGLVRQDRLTAAAVDKLADAGERVGVWVGSLRLGGLARHLAHASVGYLNLESPETRWSLGRAREWVQAAPSAWVWLGSSPLETLEIQLMWHRRLGSVLDPEKLATEFRAATAAIAKTIGEKSPRAPRLFIHPFRPEPLARFQKSKMSSQVRRFLLQRLRRGESAVVPASGIVLLSSLSLGDLAEEAAHYVRWAQEAPPEFGPMLTLVEESFAFLASTWVDPTRKPIPETETLTDSWAEIHQAAYRCGAEMGVAWKKSTKKRSKIKELWKVRLAGEADAAFLWQEMKGVV